MLRYGSWFRIYADSETVLFATAAGVATWQAVIRLADRRGGQARVNDGVAGAGRAAGGEKRKREQTDNRFHL